MMYDKAPLSIDEQIKKLQDRGIHIANVSLAKKYLSHISYYRLLGYWWPMYANKETHQFKLNSRFEDVIALYNFDHDLRMLLFDVIEKIEISLRTKLIYHLSHEYDPWWFQNDQLFADTLSLVKTLSTIQEEVERSKDIFIKEHKKKYREDKRFPPAWKTLELTSLGSLSKLYGNLKNTIKSYVHLCIMKYLLNVIQPNNSLTARLVNLMKDYPTVDPNAIGFKESWSEEPLWSDSKNTV